MTFFFRSTSHLTCLLLGLGAFASVGADETNGTSETNEAILANFADGQSSSAVDGFPGSSGHGWAGPWTIKPSVAGDSLAVTLEPGSIPPAQWATFSFTSAGGDVESSAMVRELSPSYRSFHLDQPYEISFDFRPNSILNNSGDAYLLCSGYKAEADTSQSDSWSLRSTGNRWNWNDGDKKGTAQPKSSGMTITAGTIYHFVIDVLPATQTWSVTISSGSEHMKSGPLSFRSADATSSPFLCFGVETHGAEAAVSGSLGAVQVKAIPSADDNH